MQPRLRSEASSVIFESPDLETPGVRLSPRLAWLLQSAGPQASGGSPKERSVSPCAPKISKRSPAQPELAAGVGNDLC